MLKRVFMAFFSVAMVLLSFTASASCSPDQLAGAWNVRGFASDVTASGYARFTLDQRVVVEALSSLDGSPPADVKIPLSHYDLSWDAGVGVFEKGTCRITAAYAHDGVTERYWFIYKAGVKPVVILGGDAIEGPGKTMTMTMVRDGRFQPL